MRPQEPEDTPTPLPASDPVAPLRRLARKAYSFSLSPNADEMAEIATDLGLLGLRKARLVGVLKPEAKNDWHLEAHLGATVIQPCIVTLEPVTTRLEENVSRRFVKEWESPEAGSETEMPDDDSSEPLPQSVDLRDILRESLSLALPLYPRADGAAYDSVQTAEPGVKPLTDDDVKPFAGLAALRAQMTDKDGSDDP